MTISGASNIRQGCQRARRSERGQRRPPPELATRCMPILNGFHFVGCRREVITAS
jgi:hypothetical protein